MPSKYAHIIYILLVTVFCKFGYTQVYTSSNYYYNNFNNGSLGTGLSQIGTTASWEITPTSSVNSLSSEVGYALRSNGNGKAGGLKMTALPVGTNLDTEIYGHEWTMLYKYAVNAANSDVIDANENSWKYWLYADGSDLTTAKGYFLTQVGSTLYLRWKYSNANTPTQYNTLLSFDLNTIGGSGKTFAIRVQRLKRQGQFTWHLFVDEYSASKKEATTRRGGPNYEAAFGTYNYSAIQGSSTSAGNFVFDELKVYAIQLSISGANEPANGISNPLIPGQQNVAIYGLKIKVRGLLDFYQLKFPLTGNITNLVEANTVKLYKSTDSFYGNSDDVFVVNMDCFDNAIQKYGGLNETINAIGEANGDLGIAGFYFISTNIKSNPNTSSSFSFTGSPDIIGNQSQNNYTNSGSVTNTITPPTVTGKIYTWTAPGFSSNDNWANGNNWSPTGVPGSNDVAVIGNTSATSNPVVSANVTVGNIIFDGQRNFALTVESNATLTVKGNVANERSTTITGNGKLDIKGSWISTPTSVAAVNVTSAISSLSIENLLLNPNNGPTAFNVTSGVLTLNSGYKTLSSSRAARLANNNAKIIFAGAEPINLAPGTNANNIFDFTAGVVEYAGIADQVVYGSSLPNYTGEIAYKDLVFSGMGVKKVQVGNLNITGNWSSNGGRVDLVSNHTTVNFSGTSQSILDQGSDVGNGVVFRNLNISGAGTKTLSATGKFAIDVTGTLTMGASAILQTTNNLVLRSNAAGTAQIAAVPSSASVRGKVIVQRFIQGGALNPYRGYRMLSSPVYDTPLDFQTTGVRTYKISQFIDDIIITGTGGVANGFDPSSNNGTTVFTYMNGYVPVSSTSQNVNVGSGIYMVYRGDRTNMAQKTKAGGPWPDPENTVMTFDGILNQQNVDISLPNAGYHLVGNPYAATIDWNSSNLKKTNLQDRIWIWNPHIRQYAVLSGSIATNNASKFIASGQSFFVRSTAVNASINFSEQAKATTASPNIGLTLLMSEPSNTSKLSINKVMNVGDSPSQVPDPIVRIKMQNPLSYNQDEAVLVLKSGGDRLATDDDAIDMDGEGVFLSTYSSDSRRLAINYMDGVGSFSKVDLYTSAAASGDYTLTFDISNLPNGYELVLIDNYTKTNSPISNNATIIFPIDKSDALSFAQGRLQIALIPVKTLPIQLISFIGKKTTNIVELKWKAIADEKHDHFYIKKTDGTQNELITSGIIVGPDHNFSLYDKNPFQGNNYYTLIQVDKDGKETAYGPVAVSFDVANTLNLVVYPNPIVVSCIVQYGGSDLTSNLEITDLLGNKKYQQKVAAQDLNAGHKIDLSTLASGIYFLSIKNTSGKVLATSKLIKQ